MSDWQTLWDDMQGLPVHNPDFMERLYQAFKARMKEDAQQIKKPIQDYPLEGQDG